MPDQPSTFLVCIKLLSKTVVAYECEDPEAVKEKAQELADLGYNPRVYMLSHYTPVALVKKD